MCSNYHFNIFEYLKINEWTSRENEINSILKYWIENFKHFHSKRKSWRKVYDGYLIANSTSKCSCIFVVICWCYRVALFLRHNSILHAFKIYQNLTILLLAAVSAAAVFVVAALTLSQQHAGNRGKTQNSLQNRMSEWVSAYVCMCMSNRKREGGEKNVVAYVDCEARSNPIIIHTYAMIRFFSTKFLPLPLYFVHVSIARSVPPHILFFHFWT